MATERTGQNSVVIVRTHLLALLILSGCQPASDRDESPPAPREDKPAVGEEPLETAIVDSLEVQSLTEPATVMPSTAGAVDEVRHCGWASLWSEPARPKPVLAGAAVPEPEPLRALPPRLPVRGQPPMARESVVQLVVGPDGGVSEVQIVQTMGPTWPEEDQAILAAIRDWRFAPSHVDGAPVSVCITTIINWKPED